MSQPKTALIFRSFRRTEWFPATWNSQRCALVVKKAARDMMMMSGSRPMDPHLEYMEDMASPFPWSEDMGVFTDASASGGVLFGIGAGESHPALHSENYDFPDALLPLGIDLWTRIAIGALSTR